jgi:capsular exopolysaccharide synthesis family protein
MNIKSITKQILSYYAPAAYVVRKMKTDSGVDGRLVAYTDNDSAIAEQYRVLRTGLYSLSPDKRIKAITITSTQTKEGKTITACNLAYTLSLDTEKRVVLIDADLRRASVHAVFGLPRKPGFSDVLSDTASLEHFLAKPAFGNLYIIPSGTLIENPSELLSSAKIRTSIDILKSRFDYVIFDTPPAINVTDASVLGAVCDAVILVVRAGATPKDMVDEAFGLLKRAHAEPKACILTDVVIPVHHYYMSKYRYYYRYRYSSSYKSKP